jgi:hypothetical protein
MQVPSDANILQANSEVRNRVFVIFPFIFIPVFLTENSVHVSIKIAAKV